MTTSHLNKGAGLLAGLWLTPFVLATVGQRHYALYVLAVGVSGWLRMCDLGSSGALRAYLARQYEEVDKRKTSGLVTVGFVSQTFTAVVAVVAGLFLAAAVSWVFQLDDDLADLTVWLCLFLAVESGVSLAARTFTSVLVGRQRLDQDNWIQLLSLIARFVMTVLLLQWGWGVTALGLALLSGAALRLGLSYAASRRVLDYKIGRRFFSWRDVRQVGGLGIWFSVGGAAGLMVLSADPIIAAKFVSLEAVAVLHLTGRLYQLAENLLQPTIEAARPALGALLARSDSPSALGAYIRLESLTMTLAVVFCPAVWAANEQFVGAWVGRENYGGAWLDAALAFAFLTRCWILPRRAVLASGLRVKAQSLCRFCEGGLKVGLSILLGRGFGLLGIALSSSIAGLATSVWYLERLTKKMFDARGDALRGAPRRFLAMVPLVLAALAGRLVADALSGYYGAAAGFATAAFGMAAMLWALGFVPGFGFALRVTGPVWAKQI